MIEAICRIASACRKDSLVGAITKTGYFDASDALELESISRYLKEHPNLIDDWLTYSGDKRSAPSWYFRRAGDGRYEVGFFPKEKPTFYADPSVACAIFILNELRGARSRRDSARGRKK